MKGLVSINSAIDALLYQHKYVYRHYVDFKVKTYNYKTYDTFVIQVIMKQDDFDNYFADILMDEKESIDSLLTALIPKEYRIEVNIQTEG